MTSSVFTIEDSVKTNIDPHIKLVSAAIAGDTDAFTQIYELFYQKIFKFVFYRVSHKETAEDITEEVFIKVYQSIKKLQSAETFQGWLYQIARNKIIDHYRSKKVVVNLETIENTLEYETNIIDSISLSSDQAFLLKVIKQLPDHSQQLIKLRYLEELEYSEISELLQKTEGAIRTSLHRALSELKKLMRQAEDQ